MSRLGALGRIALLLGACGCAPPAVRTSFLASVDLVDMTGRVAGSFAADEVIGARGEGDDPWVISIYRVSNHTNQIIPENEKWLYLARLRAILAESEISRQRSLVWVIPPERWAIVAEELGEDAPPALRLAPTHLLTAEFLALTLTSGRGRSDAYLCDYQLVDLDGGRIVWEDSWEVKRAVTGRTWD